MVKIDANTVGQAFSATGDIAKRANILATLKQNNPEATNETLGDMVRVAVAEYRLTRSGATVTNETIAAECAVVTGFSSAAISQYFSAVERADISAPKLTAAERATLVSAYYLAAVSKVSAKTLKEIAKSAAELDSENYAYAIDRINSARAGIAAQAKEAKEAKEAAAAAAAAGETVETVETVEDMPAKDSFTLKDIKRAIGALMADQTTPKAAGMVESIGAALLAKLTTN